MSLVKKRSTSILTFVAGVILCYASPQISVSLAQVHPGMSCSGSGAIPVYFNPGTLAGAGFNVVAAREALINTLAVWNEEAGAFIDLQYGGQTANQSMPDGVVVRFQDTWCCGCLPGGGSDNPLGKAFGCGGANTVVVIILRNCDGSLRNWKTTLSPGGTMFEGTILHELGHAVFGFPDTTGNTIMTGYGGPHNNFRHLYDVDIRSARAQAGLSWQQARRTESATGSTWSTPAVLPGGSAYTTFAPSVAGIGAGASPMYFAWPFIDSESLRVRTGPSSWTTLPNPPTTSSGFLQAVDIGVSEFNEVVVTWLGSCAQGTHCPVRWAWSNNSGSSWTTGTFSAVDGSVSRPIVHYDAFRDRFVIFYVDGTSGLIRSSSTAAWAPGWSPQVVVSDPWLPVRFLGGAAISPTSGAGIVTVAADWTSPQHFLYQMSISVSGSNYNLVPASFFGSSPDLYRTRRPFGTAWSQPQGRLMAAWRDVGGPRPMAMAETNSLTGSASFSIPTFPISNVSHSVSLGYSPWSGQWIAGIAQ